MNQSTEVRKDKENPLLNLAFNIVLPVVVLNQLSKKLGEDGPLIALLVALALPIGYGIYDFFVRRKTNYISILGVVNVAFTGGFALLNLEGFWFAIKEAFFPLLIGVAVLISNFTARPILKILFWNTNVLQVEKIETSATQLGKKMQLDRAITRASHYFAFSFFLSSFLNFFLALSIFVPIDSYLMPAARAEILNQQIADMTWKGYVVIALPMMVFMGFILFYLVNQIKQTTGLRLEQILVQENPHSASSS